MAQVDPLVKQVLDETRHGENEHKIRCKSYDNCYNIYRGYRQRPKELEPWQMDFRIPYGLYNLDTELVNIVTGNPPAVRILPRSMSWVNNVQPFQALFDYHLDQDRVIWTQVPVSQQALVYGITVGKNCWDYVEQVKTMNVPSYGPDGTGGWGPQRVTVCTKDGPHVEPWDIYDAWWDPNGRDPQDCKWFALRSYLSKAELLQNMCTVEQDHTADRCNGMFHNVEKVLECGPTQQRYMTAQDAFTRSDPKATQGLFKVVEYWYNDRLVVIGMDKVLMRDIDNPHWHGQKPIVAASTRPDVFKMRGISETETIEAIQLALWMVHNSRMDNLLLTGMRGFTVRETSVTDPKKIKIAPRAMIPVTDHDDIKPIEMPPLPPEVYREEAELLGRMQLVTGISPFVTGSNMESVDQNTATGISVLSEVASRLLRFKAAQVHNRFWNPVFEMWGQDIQQFTREDVAVRVYNAENPNEWEFIKVGPKEVAGDYDFKVVGTEEALSKQQQRSEAMALVNAFAPLAPLNIINWKPLLKKVAQAFDFDHIEELLSPPPPPAAPGPRGANGSGPTGPVQGGPPGAVQNAPLLDPRLQAVLGGQ